MLVDELPQREAYSYGKESKSAQVLVTSTERGEKYPALQDEDGIFVNSREVGPAGVSATEYEYGLFSYLPHGGRGGDNEALVGQLRL